jgi:hypothetical protein
MPLKGQAQGIDIFWQVYELSFESSGCPRTLWIAQVLMTNRNLTTSVEVAQATLGICRGQYTWRISNVACAVAGTPALFYASAL